MSDSPVRLFFLGLNTILLCLILSLFLLHLILFSLESTRQGWHSSFRITVLPRFLITRINLGQQLRQVTDLLWNCTILGRNTVTTKIQPLHQFCRTLSINSCTRHWWNKWQSNSEILRVSDLNFHLYFGCDTSLTSNHWVCVIRE